MSMRIMWQPMNEKNRLNAKSGVAVEQTLKHVFGDVQAWELTKSQMRDLEVLTIMDDENYSAWEALSGAIDLHGKIRVWVEE